MILVLYIGVDDLSGMLAKAFKEEECPTIS